MDWRTKIMPHPLVDQLRFTRSEFIRAVKGVSEKDARERILPMNCISWNVGHLAWQEQRYFMYFVSGAFLLPDINSEFAYRAPASTPSLKEMIKAWKEVTIAVDPWLDSITPAVLMQHGVKDGKPMQYTYGNMLQRVIYHYWYHLGENMAIRQQLRHEQLPEFVGDIDTQAPYRTEITDNND
jgi:uncharacterized damage-inducible protein DinB